MAQSGAKTLYKQDTLPDKKKTYANDSHYRRQTKRSVSRSDATENNEVARSMRKKKADPFYRCYPIVPLDFHEAKPAPGTW